MQGGGEFSSCFHLQLDRVETINTHVIEAVLLTLLAAVFGAAAAAIKHLACCGMPRQLKVGIRLGGVAARRPRTTIDSDSKVSGSQKAKKSAMWQS